MKGVPKPTQSVDSCARSFEDEDEDALIEDVGRLVSSSSAQNSLVLVIFGTFEGWCCVGVNGVPGKWCFKNIFTS